MTETDVTPGADPARGRRPRLAAAEWVGLAGVAYVVVAIVALVGGWLGAF